ncbi:MAG: outer membrane protein OmpK [Aeromonas sp.]
MHSLVKFSLAILFATTLSPVRATPLSSTNKWMEFKLLHTQGQLPHPDHSYEDTSFQLAFGGRFGWIDLRGQMDIFDILDHHNSDKFNDSYNGELNHRQNVFVKLAPRLSLNALTGRDLRFGPIHEVYLANLNHIADGQMENMIGFGVDATLPFFGATAINLYARQANDNAAFEEETGEWNGYHLAMQWGRPVHQFQNGSQLIYKSELDYTWGMDTHNVAWRHSDSFSTENGLYWQRDQLTVGYGVKYFNDINGMKNGRQADFFAPYAPLQSTGFSHLFSVSYKFN